MDRLRGDAVAFVHFPTAGGTKRNCPRVSSPKQERHFDRMPDLHSRPDLVDGPRNGWDRLSGDGYDNGIIGGGGNKSVRQTCCTEPTGSPLTGQLGRHCRPSWGLTAFSRPQQVGSWDSVAL